MCASRVYSEGEEKNLHLSYSEYFFSGSPIVYEMEFTFKTILMCSNIGISVLYISFFSI
jgi:hypothetical protein